MDIDSEEAPEEEVVDLNDAILMSPDQLPLEGGGGREALGEGFLMSPDSRPDLFTF